MLQQKYVAAAGCTVALVYAVFAAWQVIEPWKLHHQEVFKGVLQPGALVMGELGAAATVLVATAAAVIFNTSNGAAVWPKLLTLSITLAALEAFFWATALFKLAEQPGQSWAAILGAAWRPLLPGACVVAVSLAIDGMDKLRPGFAALRAAQYDLKRA